MSENDSVRIHHILDAAREAVGFLEGRHREDLDTDRQLNLSLVQLLEIIGEAVVAPSKQDTFKRQRGYYTRPPPRSVFDSQGPNVSVRYCNNSHKIQ